MFSFQKKVEIITQSLFMLTIPIVNNYSRVKPRTLEHSSLSFTRFRIRAHRDQYKCLYDEFNFQTNLNEVLK